jgi:glycine/D-amino acid oxidase-like deaminating enzyme
MDRITEMKEPVLPPSLWADTAREQVSTPPLTHDADVDVAIVGGGFTGLSAALHLAQSGARVICLEAGVPGWGASGRNGGQVIAGLKGDPDDLTAQFGADAGGRMIEVSGAAPALVFSLVDAHGIDCDPQRAGWIQPAHCDQAMEVVTRRCAQWRAHGADVENLDEAEVADLIGSRRNAYVGGWLDRRGGAVQPLAYARGLARAAMEAGAAVHGQSRVSALERTDNRWVLRTEAGATVRADHVILATNGYTDTLWPGLRRVVVPVYSFQTASAPLPANAADAIFRGDHVASDTRRLLWYFRLTRENRLVMGGRGPWREDPGEGPARAALANLESLFPDAGPLTPDYIWAGRVAMTKDHYPQLYRLAPGLFAGLGFNGRGVAMGTMMGRNLADLVRDGDCDWPIRDPNPFHAHAFGRIGIRAYSALYGWRDRRETEAQKKAAS